jgi:hypothetical protein
MTQSAHANTIYYRGSEPVGGTSDMMIRRGLPVAALLASGSLLASHSDALARSHQRSHLPQSHATATAPPPARIACTVLGCQPIPAACASVPGRTISGLPTGYDVIICPPGVWPF